MRRNSVHKQWAAVRNYHLFSWTNACCRCCQCWSASVDGCFVGPEAVTDTKPTLSKHWRKLGRLNPNHENMKKSSTGRILSSFVQRAFTSAVRRQCQNRNLPVKKAMQARIKVGVGPRHWTTVGPSTVLYLFYIVDEIYLRALKSWRMASLV